MKQLSLFVLAVFLVVIATTSSTFSPLVNAQGNMTTTSTTVDPTTTSTTVTTSTTATPSTTTATTAAPNTTTQAPNTTTTTTTTTSITEQPPAPSNTTRMVEPTNITQGQGTTSTVAPSTTAAPSQTTTLAPPPPTTTQQQQQQTTSTVAPREETTSEAPQQSSTTTQAPTPTKKRNPRVQFVLSAIARARANTTAANFKALLAKMLSIPANAMTVEYDESSGAMLVEFKEDATDSSGNTLNATAEFEKAVTLDSSELSSLGAASVTSAEPAPAPEDAPEEEKKFPVALVAGICGGFAFILIVILIIKAKAGSAGTGAAASTAAANGDRPMLEVPQQQHQARNTIDNEL